MSKIIACIDGSAYADSVCEVSAWISKQTQYTISLLHVVTPHSDMAAKSDLSGQIGLGAKSGLLKKLTEVDEQRGKLEQQKGHLMLEHAKEELTAKGIAPPEILHRRGSLVDTLSDLENEAEQIVIGKRGEQAGNASSHLGSNLERVARSLHKPLIVASREIKPVERFLIAYDGSASSNKAVEYAARSPLFAGLECHVLSVAEEMSASQEQAATTLQSAGFTVTSATKQGKAVDDIICEYINEHAITLMLIGAYGHSRLRSMILGSTTTALIQNVRIPLMLFR
jgi:nucleotide-binding universal stress UspA family protein